MEYAGADDRAENIRSIQATFSWYHMKFAFQVFGGREGKSQRCNYLKYKF